MSLVVPDTSERVFLSVILNKISSIDYYVLHLYTNNKVPAGGDTLADYVEATGAGYAPINLLTTNWNIVLLSGVTTAVYPQQQFKFAAEPTVYGYYVTNDSSTELMWAERFSNGPYAVPGPDPDNPLDDGRIRITLKVGLD